MEVDYFTLKTTIIILLSSETTFINIWLGCAHTVQHVHVIVHRLRKEMVQKQKLTFPGSFPSIGSNSSQKLHWCQGPTSVLPFLQYTS